MVETAIVTAGTTLLLGGGDTVSNDLRENGPLNATVQAANNKAKQTEVAKSLISKGVSSKKADGIAEAIVGRLNGQGLTRTQKNILSSALNSSAVQDTISGIMKKRSAGIDSTLQNAYDEINTIGGNENGGETALWNLQNQRADGSLPSSQDQTRAEAENRSGVPGTLGENYRTFQETLSAARRGLTSDLDAFSDDDYATVTEGSALRQVQNGFREEYGIECHVIRDSSWTRSSPAYSRDGVVYIREGIDLGTLSTAVPHEATHVMKQQRFQPYVDFILRTPDMLNFQSEVIQKLLDRVADHKKIDPFDASPQQLFSFYDELNAVVYGLYKSGVLDSNEFDYHEYIPGAFNNFTSYIQAMDRLHEEFRNQHNVPAQAKAADGGVDALMNLANEVAGVSSAEMESTLTSQIDKVNQDPTARNVGQLNATVQTANNQANAAVDQEAVAKSLRNKGISYKKADGIAEVIVARLNGQELTRTQRELLSVELGSPTVQNVISELIQNKSNGIDSAQHNVYDEISAIGGNAATEGSARRQDQNMLSDDSYEIGADVPNQLKPQNLMEELASSGVKYNLDEVIAVTKTPDGNLLWLEQGNTRSGLTHILERHAEDFASQGVDDIPQLLNDVVKNSPIKTGSNSKGLFADYVLNGNTYRVAFGTNGYIVSFYPID